MGFVVWSQTAGVLQVQPPPEVLAEMLAIVYISTTRMPITVRSECFRVRTATDGWTPRSTTGKRPYPKCRVTLGWEASWRCARYCYTPPRPRTYPHIAA